MALSDGTTAPSPTAGGASRAGRFRSRTATSSTGGRRRVECAGGFVARGYFNLKFGREKGRYFEDSTFGKSIAPDTDVMVRNVTVALRRLQLRTAAFRACYAKLSDEEAARLRAAVASPDGFAGLDVALTGYESAEALAAACEADDWVLDFAAVGRPLFPGVDEATGCCSPRRCR